MIFKLFKTPLFVLILFTAPHFISAGTTGKLAGKITELNTGEGIPGINIIIENTLLGAASDTDGEYVINNIPPGEYVVVISGVGFQKKIFTDVKVASDFTTRLDTELSTQVIEIEAVVVQAEAPMIRKDLTSSKTTVDAGQIKSLPVENISQILTLQAGVIKGAGGELHIRGGRSSEIAYTVNGVSVTNPYNNSRSVEISTNAIQELSVVSGTFNAEYGNALSGIVNTITKEASDSYKGYLSFYTGDYLSSRDNIFFNIGEVNPLNNLVTEMTLSGPLPFTRNKVLLFLSGRYNKDNGYLFGERVHNPSDSVFKNKTNPNDIRVVSTGDGKKVSMNQSKDLNTTAKLTFRPLSTLKVNYDLIYSDGEYQLYNHDFKLNPEANYNNYEWGLLNSLEIRHALNNSTFYTFRLAYNVNDFKQYLYPLLNSSNTAVDFSPGMDLTNLHADPDYQPEHKLNRVANYTFSSGGTLNNHFYQRTKTFEGKFDLTSQVTRQHEIKFGIQTRIHSLNYENFEILRDSINYLNPTIPGINTSKHDKYSKDPVEFSAYVQDKMEFENFIFNIGIRYDYIKSNSDYSNNTLFPSPNSPTIPSYVDKNSLLSEAEAKHKVSPRLGFSFPITDQGIIHFSYGHFYQIPPFRYLYANPNFKSSFDVGTPIYGNANLNPEFTVAYELGLQQQLTQNLAFNITGFYKDVRDLLALEQIRVSSSETYFKYVNKDYGNIKGITFSLTKRKTADELFGATLDYTFQAAEGNETNTDAFFIDLSSGRQSEKVPVYLTWDQTHTINSAVFVGAKEDWNLTLVARFGTGLPYTPELSSRQIFLRTNSGRKPTQITVDLLAEKSLDFFGTAVTFFLKVFNLFDTLNERLVYNDTGRSTYSLEQTKGSALATDEIAKNIPGVRSVEEYFNRPEFYLPPREVRFGASVEF